MVRMLKDEKEDCELVPGLNVGKLKCVVAYRGHLRSAVALEIGKRQ